MASPPPVRMATSPVQSNGHPPHGLPLPPEKRQKLSHGPSPLGTSPVSTPGPYSPYSPQWSPHTMVPQQPPSVAYYPPNPLESFNQPQPVQSPSFDSQPHNSNSQRQNNAGAMGPPERPQKPLDPNDITDMVALSGVDLRAEDEYLAQSYLRSTSFTTSFGSQRSSTPSQGNNSSFTQWSQANYGSQPAFEAGRPFNQPPVTEKTLEDELREKHKRQARKYAELRQVHMRDPFLAAQRVREQIEKRAYEEHVRFNQQGIRDIPVRPPGELQPQDVQAKTMMGSDGTGLVAAKAEVSVRHTVEQDSPVIEVLSLLSLAANERLRTVLEDAFAVSRARRFGSHGVVPPEWSSIAEGSGPSQDTTAASQSITHTSWDRPPERAVSPSAPQPPKPTDSNGARLPTPPTEPSPPPQPQPTIAYKSMIPSLLRDIAAAEREMEKKRLEKRKRRQSSLAPGTSSEGISTPAAPSTPAGVDPAVAVASVVPPKMTKKALAAEKKSAVNEEVQRKQANATANMALGGGGKKYSWLSGGKTAGGGGLTAGAGMGRGVGTTPKSGSAPGTPGPSSASGAAASGTGKQGVASQEDPGLRSKELWKKLGMWREDGEGGKGIQMRDLVNVLERDGLEKRTLSRCYHRLKSDEKER
ncbi:uncharacterized protein PV09_04081 [Verruconis gallopava]|uniref:Transcription initiation factor TFIID subunit 4 n=1 Tax=Verruconis gallopava TaxID=253628 RepID=A0A0D2AEN8_9PEZI|nr:uncharacterized protein PV09_04081 [Verruconis gallopava]KIW04910.1 hypothetical protein PV09_04081 [Verruconis gallopava]